MKNGEVSVILPMETGMHEEKGVSLHYVLGPEFSLEGSAIGWKAVKLRDIEGIHAFKELEDLQRD